MNMLKGDEYAKKGMNMLKWDEYAERR